MKRIIGISFVALAVALFSCNNEKVDTPEMNDELMEKSAQISINEVKAEAATVESEYEVEFFSNAEQTLSYWWRIGKKFSWNTKLRYRVNHCPTVSITGTDEEVYPRTITLDYGEATELKNGKVLSGEITITITAPRKSKAYSRTVSYQDFGVDTLIINGTSIVELDKVDNMFRKFSSNLLIELPDGTTIERDSEKIWQWLAGNESDEDQEDDIVTITGADTSIVNWIDGNSDSYIKVITEPLKKISECKYIVDGTVEIKLGDNVISIMDYGYAEDDDECDKWAELETADGATIIDLSERKMREKKEQNQKGKGNSNNQGGKGNGK